MEKHEDWEIFWKASEEIELNYHLEQGRVHELQNELTQAKNLIQSLETLLQKEKDLRQNALGELAKTQARFEKAGLLVKHIAKENEKLKSLYPLHDLWVAKQLEIDRLNQSLEAIPNGQAEVSVIKNLIRAHEAQREELKWLLEDAEARFAEQSRRIERFDIEVSTSLESPAQVLQSAPSGPISED